MEGINDHNELLRMFLANQAEQGRGNRIDATAGSRDQGVETAAGPEPVVPSRMYRETPMRRNLRAVQISVSTYGLRHLLWTHDFTQRLVRNFFKSTYKGAAPRNADGTTCTAAATMDNFVLDLTARPGTAFNKGARRVFVHAFINRDCPDTLRLKPSIEEIERLFISNFRSVQKLAAFATLSPEEQEAKRRAHRRKERQRSVSLIKTVLSLRSH